MVGYAFKFIKENLNLTPRKMINEIATTILEKKACLICSVKSTKMAWTGAAKWIMSSFDQNECKKHSVHLVNDLPLIMVMQLHL